MSDIVISVKNMSKAYRLGVIGTGTFYGDLKRWWARKFGKHDPYLRIGEDDHGNLEGDTIWALKKVNFDIQRGETLGIIGSNGAGKSTLLKILSQVTAPTSGTVKIKGRVGSLLEVGTGFHPELTGRENVYLNGAIMGMDRGEVSQKLDEIVDFSGVEKFIDTPVKRYSSGMYVRLAFAVAAHLEPEILVVDEVLAVGDAEFQKKCLGKMDSVASEGRTVLFVSHNLTSIEALCSRAMMISRGRNSQIGDTSETVSKYLETIDSITEIPLHQRTDRMGKGKIRVTSIGLEGSRQASIASFSIGDDICVRANVKNNYAESVHVRVSLSIYTAHETLISCDSNLKGEKFFIHGNSETVLRCIIKSPPLNIGNYYINLSIFNGDEAEDRIRPAAKFSIDSGTFDNRLTTNFFPVLSKFDWEVQPVNKK